MGFDVSFHPISPAEMDMWYFTPLEWVRQGQKDKVLDLAEQYGMEAFYAQKYLSVLQAVPLWRNRSCLTKATASTWRWCRAFS